jgi:hypothetical protein
MRKHPYQQLLERKRTWTPVRPTAGKLKEGSEETIKRALAIRHLELPVGEFIKEALEDIPELSRELLEDNVRDEDRHDIALNYIASAHGVDEKAEAEAHKLQAAWDAHPDHTVLKALTIEKAIFFVLLPFFRFNGDTGLRVTSADISRDETIHVSGHSLVCKELGLTPSPSLDKLRKATINWVLQPLGDSEDRYLNKKFWLEQSDNLMYRGKAEGLADTKRARVPAFFETSNSDLPSYA